MYRLDDGSVIPYGPRATGGAPVRLPCGACSGCLMERSQMWSLRCRHEASVWDHNVFVTLTYDDAHLPWHGSLNREHVQKFIRSLRKRASGVQTAPGSDRRPIRYFGCGEYGSKSKRAHYHILLFNLRLSDRTKFGKDTYTSALLSELWTKGTHLVGSVTPASAAYTAGYATKKVVGRLESEAAYGVVNPSTGEYVERVREFNFMSLKPGIGQYWYDKYKRDIRDGYVVVDGAKVPVPRFYEDKYKADFPEEADEREYMRYVARMATDPNEKTEDRLVVKEMVAAARKRLFKRETLLEG